jgi:SAM-dependent methyltransferase
MDLIAYHTWMLNDVVRMQAYRQAIFNVVQQGDVVLDVGTGSGIMALFACQAGARKVYAVEAGEIISIARQLARENGFADRITFLNQDVRDLQQLELVDVITSELISNSGPGENMAQIINLCRERFLKPGGKIVPQSVELCLAPLDDPQTYRKACPPDPAAYDIDFSFLQRYSVHLPLRARISPQALLSAGRTAYAYHAYTATDNDDFQASLDFEVERPGTLHGYGSWFHATLADGVELTNMPLSTTHWDNIFFPLPQPVPLEPGMTISLDFSVVNNGAPLVGWIWNTVVRNGDQVVASFEQNSRLGDHR